MGYCSHEADATALIEGHLGLVRRIAGRLKAALPARVDVEDLVADGMFGLVKAAGRWDPARRVKFGTYAYRYVRGAMLDGLEREARQCRLVKALRDEAPRDEGRQDGRDAEMRPSRRRTDG